MWVALFCLALVVAIIWLAAIFLAVRDSIRGDRSLPCKDLQPEELAADPIALPRWKQILAVPLAAVVVPPVAVVLLVLGAPLVLMQLGCFAYHSLRYKLFGIPMPRFELPDEA